MYIISNFEIRDIIRAYESLGRTRRRQIDRLGCKKNSVDDTHTYMYMRTCICTRRHVSKAIIPSIKRPGTNFRDELLAISSASKRNAHEEEAEPAESSQERRLLRGESLEEGVPRLMTTARLTLSLERSSFGVGGGRGRRRKGRFTSISSVSTR